MSAIFGFTFHIDRMTEVLTPDIYRAHWAAVPGVSPGRGLLIPLGYLHPGKCNSNRKSPELRRKSRNVR